MACLDIHSARTVRCRAGREGRLDRAVRLLPEERPYPVADGVLARLRA
jgi:hypothetical protein